MNTAIEGRHIFLLKIKQKTTVGCIKQLPP